MKKTVFLFINNIYICLVCAGVLLMMCACGNDPYAGDITYGNNDTLPTVPENLNFDFQGDGLIVQTEQYGKCRIEVASTESSATVVISGEGI